MNYLTVMLPEIVQNMSLIRGIFIAHSYLLKYMCYTGEILCMYIYSIYVFNILDLSSFQKVFIIKIPLLFPGGTQENKSGVYYEFWWRK